MDDGATEYRVLFLLPELFRRAGGIERFNRDLLRAVGEGRTGIRGLVLVLNDEPALGSQRLPDTLTLAACARGPLRILWQLNFAAQAVWRTWRFRPQLLFCGHSNFLALAWFLHRVFRVPYVTMLHGIEAWGLEGAVARRALAGSRKILCTTPHTVERVRQRCGLDAGKLAVLPCAVDGAQFSPRAKSEGLLRRYGLEGQRVLLTVSRLTPEDRYKGHATVLRALASLLPSRRDLRYLIVGQGEYARELDGLAQQLDIREQVIFAGPAGETELVDYYNLCDVFVMPSTGEGFGIVYLEALACGKPVIAGNRDGSVHALLGGKAGLLVDPDDVPAVAEGIANMLDRRVEGNLLDPGYLRTTILRHYGFESFQERVCGLFRELRAAPAAVTN